MLRFKIFTGNSDILSIGNGNRRYIDLSQFNNSIKNKTVKTMQNTELKKVADAMKRLPVSLEGYVMVHLDKDKTTVYTDLLTQPENDSISRHLQNKYNEYKQSTSQTINK